MKQHIKYIVSAFVIFLAASVSTVIAEDNLVNPEAQISDTQASIQNIIEDQLAAFIAGDAERAYSHAAPGIRQIFKTKENFMNMVESGYGPIYRSSSYIFGKIQQSNNRILQELILTDQTGKTWESIYMLEQQEDGSWKIGGVQMRASKGSLL